MYFNSIEFEKIIEQTVKLLAEKLQQVEDEINCSPDGSVRCGVSHGRSQFFRVDKFSGKNGTYIPKKEIELIDSLCQKKYDARLAKSLKSDVLALKKLGSELNLHYERIFEKMSPGIRGHVSSLFETFESYSQKWRTVEYEKMPFETDSAEFYTANGLRVRSKSECIIADTLDRLNIPFKYEVPLRLKGLRGNEIELHPDFCCLTRKDGKEIFWEHFGMMDKEDYANNMVKKLELYQHNGIFPGDRLVITMESSVLPFTSLTADEVARKYLCF